MFDIFRVGKLKEEIAELQAKNNALTAKLKKTTEKSKAAIDGLESESESLKKRLKQIEETSTELESLTVVQRKELLSSLASQVDKLTNDRQIAERELADLQSKVRSAQSELVVVNEDLLLETFGLYNLKLPLLRSEDFKERLMEIRSQQKALITDGRATAYLALTVQGDEKAGKKLTADIQKLLIRAFNNECDLCVQEVKFNNVERFKSRIQKSFDALNKIGSTMYAQITEQFKGLKIQELECAYEYQVVKQREKDELRKQRELLRDAQKAEQEIRAAREAIEKERKHFASAINALDKRIDAASDDLLRQELIAQKTSLTEKVAALQTKEKEIDYREQNAKAGFVYIISNLGAFGENVFKIGMTRRLEPLERIDELGDASVPFEFDLHALVFSDDAPALEAKIHGHFESQRVNKINRRKEFFKAELKEIEHVVRANYDKVFELTYEATAEQYRESLRLSDVKH